MTTIIGILELLWMTIGFWMIPLALGVLAMAAIMFIFEAIGFIIVLLTDKY
jgi:hypothetical protein